MLSTDESSDIKVPYEEEINGFTIYIEDNPDRWCGGYIWSVCQNEIIWDEGLSFTASDAINSAKANIAPAFTIPLA